MSDQLWKRIKEARTAAKLTQQAVADAFGIDRVAVSLWESSSDARRTRPDIGRLRELAKITGVKMEWLLGADGDPIGSTHLVSRDETDPAYVRFPLLEGYAGMGPGTFISDYPEVVKDLRVSREWVSQKMPGIPHDVIRVITGRGDSMRGQYNDGDLIFVDTRVKSFDQDSAYCFRWAGRVQVKRLQLIKPGIVRILSKNPDYESIDAEVEEIEIGGRAIAAWTLREF
ncbi:S24 family peptidase [Frateuria aurantia]|uniref:Putative transcriptional regulator n=1 Tax=Frateuria aurantia (strain ATCC 33424 / DSM 6220 / KCTC 2777 / LMG 1558 / NBRC 3245 / NCIMB 13370) TaxID=767434 RepID=H8L1T9_FRAAD|nr:S24 family peptidase [Frateuria aurantia]AFC86350.1 putative transcriptional regulator [Frateuria aurantia DSM 6220]